jgi:hypothetical protein
MFGDRVSKDGIYNLVPKISLEETFSFIPIYGEKFSTFKSLNGAIFIEIIPISFKSLNSDPFNNIFDSYQLKYTCKTINSHINYYQMLSFSSFMNMELVNYL